MLRGYLSLLEGSLLGMAGAGRWLSEVGVVAGRVW